MTKYDAHAALNAETYKQKDATRKELAGQSFAEKIATVMRLQMQFLEMRKSRGMEAPRPWNMSEEQYQREMNEAKQIRERLA